MSFKEIILASVFCFAVLFITTYPARVAPFNIEDDNFYIKITQPQIGYFKEFEKAEKFSTFPSFYKNFASLNGRFCPIGTSFVYSIAKIADANPLRVQVILFTFSLLCGVLFFILFRLLSFTVFLSLLFSGLLLAGHSYTVIWYRLNGELFALSFVALFFISAIKYFRSNDKIYLVLSIISMLFFSFMKESFPPLIPSIILLVIILNAYEKKTSLEIAFQKTKPFLFSGIALLLISAIGILYVFNFSKIEMSSFISLNNILNNLIAFSGYRYQLLLILSALILFLYCKKINSLHLAIFAAWLLWIFSQVFIYSKMGITQVSRYQMPALLFPLMLSAISANEIRKMNLKFMYPLLLICLSFVLLISMKNSYSNASYYAARATSYNRMLDVLKTKANPSSDKILMVAEKGRADEFMGCTATYLSFGGADFSPSQLQYLEAGTEEVFLHETKGLMEKGKKTKHVINKTVFLNEVASDTSYKWLLFCRPVENIVLNPDEFGNGFKNKLVFSEPYFYAGTKEVFFSIFGKKVPGRKLSFVMFER